VKQSTLVAAVAVAAIVLTAAPVFVLGEGAVDEPYDVFRPYDAVVQVGVATAVLTLWLVVAAVIVADVVHARFRGWLLPRALALLWIIILVWHLLDGISSYLGQVSRHVTARRPNQAMQLTASKPAVYASRVCRRARMDAIHAQSARGS
jgi:hypothetical protein